MKKYLFFPLICFAILLNSTCSKKIEYTLRMPAENLLNNYNIISSTESITQLILNNIHATLIEYNNGLYTGDTAHNWFTPEQGKYSFILKNDIKFSDGRSLNAIDVKDSYELMAQHPLSRFIKKVTIDSIIIIDHKSLDIYSNEPLTVIREFFANVGILKSEDINKGEDYLCNCATAGIYFIYSNTDTLLILKKNKFHRDYKKNKLAPDNIELILQPIKTLEYDMLINNQVDFIQYIPMSLFKQAYTDKNYHIIEKETGIITYLALNATTPYLDTIKPISISSNQSFQNPLKNKNVRQAIAHAIDIKYFLNELLLMKANYLIIPALREKFGYPTDIDCYSYDLDLSKSLMNQAGYNEGFVMTINANEGFLYSQIAHFIEESLKNINIIVNTNIISPQDLVAINPNRAAGIYTMVDNHETRLANSLRLWFYYDQNAPRQNRFKNYNQNINLLLDKLRIIEDTDPEAPLLYNELTNIIIDETFIIPIMNHLDIYLLNKKFNYLDSNELKFTNFIIAK